MAIHGLSIYLLKEAILDPAPCEVTDRSLSDELDRALVQRLGAQDYKGCWLACPEIVEWADVRGFRYGQARKYVEYHDLRLPQFMLSVSPPQSVDREMLGRRRAFCIRDDDRVMKDWSIYECLNCEIDHEGMAFLLSCGHWYRIDQDFVTRVNLFVDKIPRFEGVCRFSKTPTKPPTTLV